MASPSRTRTNIDTAGVLTTAASGVFADRVPKEDAEVVRRLSAAGAVVIGKLNMHEFALGTTSSNQSFWAGEQPMGARSDRGRIVGRMRRRGGGEPLLRGRWHRHRRLHQDPAACCGIVGLKPTYGVVSAQGTVPVSASFDHVGPMCRTSPTPRSCSRAMTDHPIARAFEPDSPPGVSALRVGVAQTAAPVCDEAVERECRRRSTPRSR